MTPMRTLLCVLLPLALGACTSSPSIHYLSLDDGQPATVGSPMGLSVAVTQVNLPELIDRPQLVVRSSGHQLQLSDQYEWAEPLRRQIPRLIARGLGKALDSGRVVALPVDAQDFDPDFKVVLDVQRLEVIAGQCVDLDVVWRVDTRDGKAFFGRSLVQEPIETASEADGYQAAVAAESRAFRSVSANIALGITDWLNATAHDGLSTNGDLPCADPRAGKERRHGV